MANSTAVGSESGVGGVRPPIDAGLGEQGWVACSAGGGAEWTGVASARLRCQIRNDPSCCLLTVIFTLAGRAVRHTNLTHPQSREHTGKQWFKGRPDKEGAGRP